MAVVSTCFNELLVAELLNSSLLIIVLGVTVHLVLSWQIVKWTLLLLLLELTGVVLLHIHHSIVVVLLVH